MKLECTVPGILAGAINGDIAFLQPSFFPFASPPAPPPAHGLWVSASLSGNSCEAVVSVSSLRQWDKPCGGHSSCPWPDALVWEEVVLVNITG